MQIPKVGSQSYLVPTQSDPVPSPSSKSHQEEEKKISNKTSYPLSKIEHKYRQALFNKSLADGDGYLIASPKNYSPTTTFSQSVNETLNKAFFQKKFDVSTEVKGEIFELGFKLSLQDICRFLITNIKLPAKEIRVFGSSVWNLTGFDWLSSELGKAKIDMHEILSAEEIKILQEEIDEKTNDTDIFVVFENFQLKDFSVLREKFPLFLYAEWLKQKKEFSREEKQKGLRLLKERTGKKFTSLEVDHRDVSKFIVQNLALKNLNVVEENEEFLYGLVSIGDHHAYDLLISPPSKLKRSVISHSFQLKASLKGGVEDDLRWGVSSTYCHLQMISDRFGKICRSEYFGDDSRDYWIRWLRNALLGTVDPNPEASKKLSGPFLDHCKGIMKSLHIPHLPAAIAAQFVKKFNSFRNKEPLPGLLMTLQATLYLDSMLQSPEMLKATLCTIRKKWEGELEQLKRESQKEIFWRKCDALFESLPTLQTACHLLPVMAFIQYVCFPFSKKHEGILGTYLDSFKKSHFLHMIIKTEEGGSIFHLSYPLEDYENSLITLLKQDENLDEEKLYLWLEEFLCLETLGEVVPPSPPFVSSLRIKKLRDVLRNKMETSSKSLFFISYLTLLSFEKMSPEKKQLESLILKFPRILQEVSSTPLLLSTLSLLKSVVQCSTEMDEQPAIEILFHSMETVCRKPSISSSEKIIEWIKALLDSSHPVWKMHAYVIWSNLSPILEDHQNNLQLCGIDLFDFFIKNEKDIEKSMNIFWKLHSLSNINPDELFRLFCKLASFFKMHPSSPYLPPFLSNARLYIRQAPSSLNLSSSGSLEAATWIVDKLSDMPEFDPPKWIQKLENKDLILAKLAFQKIHTLPLKEAQEKIENAIQRGASSKLIGRLLTLLASKKIEGNKWKELKKIIPFLKSLEKEEIKQFFEDSVPLLILKEFSFPIFELLEEVSAIISEASIAPLNEATQNLLLDWLSKIPPSSEEQLLKKIVSILEHLISPDTLISEALHPLIRRLLIKPSLLRTSKEGFGTLLAIRLLGSINENKKRCQEALWLHEKKYVFGDETLKEKVKNCFFAYLEENMQDDTFSLKFFKTFSFLLDQDNTVIEIYRNLIKKEKFSLLGKIIHFFKMTPQIETELVRCVVTYVQKEQVEILKHLFSFHFSSSFWDQVCINLKAIFSQKIFKADDFFQLLETLKKLSDLSSEAREKLSQTVGTLIHGFLIHMDKNSHKINLRFLSKIADVLLNFHVDEVALWANILIKCVLESDRKGKELLIIFFQHPFIRQVFEKSSPYQGLIWHQVIKAMKELKSQEVLTWLRNLDVLKTYFLNCQNPEFLQEIIENVFLASPGLILGMKKEKKTQIEWLEHFDAAWKKYRQHLRHNIREELVVYFATAPLERAFKIACDIYRSISLHVDQPAIEEQEALKKFVKRKFFLLGGKENPPLLTRATNPLEKHLQPPSLPSILFTQALHHPLSPSQFAEMLEFGFNKNDVSSLILFLGGFLKKLEKPFPIDIVIQEKILRALIFLLNQCNEEDPYLPFTCDDEFQLTFMKFASTIIRSEIASTWTTWMWIFTHPHLTVFVGKKRSEILFTACLLKTVASPQHLATYADSLSFISEFGCGEASLENEIRLATVSILFQLWNEMDEHFNEWYYLCLLPSALEIIICLQAHQIQPENTMRLFTAAAFQRVDSAKVKGNKFDFSYDFLMRCLTDFSHTFSQITERYYRGSPSEHKVEEFTLIIKYAAFAPFYQNLYSSAGYLFSEYAFSNSGTLKAFGSTINLMNHGFNFYKSFPLTKDPSLKTTQIFLIDASNRLISCLHSKKTTSDTLAALIVNSQLKELVAHLFALEIIKEHKSEQLLDLIMTTPHFRNSCLSFSLEELYQDIQGPECLVNKMWEEASAFFLGGETKNDSENYKNLLVEFTLLIIPIIKSFDKKSHSNLIEKHIKACNTMDKETLTYILKKILDKIFTSPSKHKFEHFLIILMHILNINKCANFSVIKKLLEYLNGNLKTKKIEENIKEHVFKLITTLTK